jgi:hypothetical protein
MSEYDGLNRNFVSFKYANRLNAAMRENSFDIIRSWIFDADESVLPEIEETYQDSKNTTNELSDLVTVEDMGNFVIVDIDSILAYTKKSRETIANYTGLIANNVAARHSKLCLSYISTSDYDLKGSARDPYSRNILNIVRNLTYAEGHASAFGWRCERLRLLNFKRNMARLNNMLEVKDAVDMIVLNGNDSTFRWDVDVFFMARYNEVAGVLPRAVVRIVLDRSWKFEPLSKNYNGLRISKKGREIVSFLSNIGHDSIILVSPILGKDNNAVLHVSAVER